MKKDIEEAHRENESFQTEVEALRLDLKCRYCNEEYRERAFTSLRKAIKKKDRQLKSLEDELNYAQVDKNFYLYQIELLEDKLKESEEKKGDLQFECDELRETVKQLKKIKETDENNFAQMDKKYYLYQIELLEHIVKLNESKESNEDLQFVCDTSLHFTYTLMCYLKRYVMHSAMLFPSVQLIHNNYCNKDKLINKVNNMIFKTS